MARTPSAAAMAAMDEADDGPPADALKMLRSEVAALRELDLEISDLSDRLAEAQARRSEAVNKRLPDLFQEVGVRAVTVDADRNMPAVKAELRPFYAANIAASWPGEKQDAGLDYLEEIGEGDMIKNVVSVEFPMGTAAQQRKLVATLSKMGLEYSARRRVPHGTLTAWVRERYKQNRPLSDREKELLGAAVGMVVNLKEVK